MTDSVPSKQPVASSTAGKSQQQSTVPPAGTPKRFIFIFRFFGRFVFAQQKDALDKLDAWAVDMTHNPDVSAQPHQALLSAPRGLVARAGSMTPDLKVMALTCHPDAQSEIRLEHSVWNIEDYDIEVLATGQFSWSKKDTLLDFKTLVPEAAGGPAAGALKIDAQALPITARVRFADGTGEAKSLFGHNVNMVTLSEAPLDEQTLATMAGKAIAPADLVEVTVRTTQTPLILSLTRRDGTGPTSTIALEAEAVDIPTVVNFTNVCRGADDAPVDEEFAGLYEVLASPPRTRDRLVPQALDGLGGPDDCFVSAYLEYQ